MNSYIEFFTDVEIETFRNQGQVFDQFIADMDALGPLEEENLEDKPVIGALRGNPDMRSTLFFAYIQGYRRGLR